jgi:ABC-type molybdenum transport system ATPase subunit/photorepair protein PhrA
MTRITKIDIKNFRAFYGNYTIDLKQDGKNLLICGENGSGKSSLLLATKLLIDSYIQNLNFSEHRNRFANTDEDAFIKVTTSNNDNTGDSIHTWTETVRDTGANLIRNAAKTKGILDYKALLEVYFLQRENSRLNVFNLLIENLLANSTDRITGKEIGTEWKELIESIPRSRGYKKQARELQQNLDLFTERIRVFLRQLQEKASEILTTFNHSIQLEFQFSGLIYNSDTKEIDGKEIILTVSFLQQTINSPHQFLNEAKLSAIALSLYLASLLITPDSDLNILVLDDVLIGLDMSNRLPVINILHDHFQHYQTFFMTYDREWYNIMKQKIEASDTRDNWLYLELFYSRIDDELEIPVFSQDKDYLAKAKEYLNANDFKAAAIYLRTAFEVLIKKFCEKKALSVLYKEDPKKLIINNFLKPIKEGGKDRNGNRLPYISDQLERDIDQYLTLVMNPLSHARFVTVYRQEIEDAITTIENLEDALFPPNNRR